jgi:hypothetical protein
LILDIRIFYFIIYKFKIQVCFGNFNQKANVLLYNEKDCSDNCVIRDANEASLGIGVTSSFKVPVDTWYHLAVVLKNTTVSIYVNGTLSVSRSGQIAFSTVNTVRHENFIGMTEGVAYSSISNIILDEVKLYDKALNEYQIVLDMNAEDRIVAGIC